MLGVAALNAAGIRLCLFHRWTGLPCLTCGSTRACAALVAGDLLGAFRMQPLVSALLVASAIAGGAHTLLLAVWRTVKVDLSAGERRGLILAGVALAVVNWAYLLRHGV
ncbi:MAG TPA: DUF2752 domain-containing protein [Kiritimatiellia bacterium]|mgnify:CR=1 FL=1|nr:DUF2752 domain-containing protein [Kiritimatiellia bacterium]HRU70770.1 DUF2752 domain-containing protein [Kiritimatiellia bacterium]